MTRRIRATALVLVAFSAMLTSKAEAATFSGSVAIDCDGFTGTGDLGFTIDDGEGSETVRILAFDAAYSDPIATPSITMLDTTRSGDVGTAAPLGDGTWTTPPTHNPLFLTMVDGDGSGFWETWGVCEGLPWAQPLVGATSGLVQPGTTLSLVVASCWGTSAYAELTQGGPVLSSVQTGVFALPAAGPPASVPLENRVDLPIPAGLAAGSALTATVVCGTSAAPLSPPGTLQLQIAGSTSSTTGPPVAGTTGPRFTG